MVVAEVEVVGFRQRCEEELRKRGWWRGLWFFWVQRELENGPGLGKGILRSEDGVGWVSVASERPLLSVAFWKVSEVLLLMLMLKMKVGSKKAPCFRRFCSIPRPVALRVTR